MKRTVIILSVLIFFIVGSTQAKKKQNEITIDNFIGTWLNEIYIDGLEEHLPAYYFKLILEKDSTKENAFKAWHCIWRRGGTQIDCDNDDEMPIRGKFKNGKVHLHFVNNWDDEVKAKLYFDKSDLSNLIWELGKYKPKLVHFFDKKDTLQKVVEFDVWDFYNSNEVEGFYARLNSGQILLKDQRILDNLLNCCRKDSLVINKEFDNKNLEITVVNPYYYPEYESNEDYPRVDGIINYIVVNFNSDSLVYYNPNPPMSLINLDENNIYMKDIIDKQAVFIPFNYCSNADDEMEIIYIVLYDHQKYLYHITLRGENEFADYKIIDDLDEKFKDLPAELKQELIDHINAEYETIAGLISNKITLDLDDDGKDDRVYFVNNGYKLVCELSSNEYRKIVNPVYPGSFNAELSKSERGFGFNLTERNLDRYNWERGYLEVEFAYDKEAKKMRLVYQRDNYYDGIYGTYSYEINFLTGKIRDYQEDYIINKGAGYYIEIEDEILKIPPIYFDDMDYSVFKEEQEYL
jgi:hypothetical protein